jgi:DHA2 family multidrug resistance protein-like MFS transporter
VRRFRVAHVVGTGLLLAALVVGVAPPERAGVASALSETADELGGSLGIAVLGSLGAAVYRAQMAEGMPAGVPAGVADAARQTLGAAESVAATLPAGAGQALTRAAEAAFVSGLQGTEPVPA